MFPVNCLCRRCLWESLRKFSGSLKGALRKHVEQDHSGHWATPLSGRLAPQRPLPGTHAGAASLPPRASLGPFWGGSLVLPWFPPPGPAVPWEPQTPGPLPWRAGSRLCVH